MAEVDMKFETSSSLNLPSNSDKLKVKDKEEPKEKRVEKVVSGDVTVKKKRSFSRFKKNMIAEDLSDVGNYVFHDIILPAFKDLIFDAARGSLEMILYGRASRKNKQHHTSYSSISTYTYNGKTNAKDRPTDSRDRKRNADYLDVSEVLFESRKDAEEVLDSLRTVLENYPSVSVGDFYDTLGQSAPFTATKYGWTNLNDVSVRHCKDGYYIDFSTPKLID